MKLVIDRIEGKFAICENEDGSMTNIPKYKLPQGIKEGDIIIEHEGFLKVDNDGTLAERERMKAKINKLLM